MTDIETSTVEIWHPIGRGRTDVRSYTFASLPEAITFITLLLWGGIEHIILRGPKRYLSNLEGLTLAKLSLERW